MNLLTNGDFLSWPRGTSFDSTTTPANNDAAFLPGYWFLLSDGNDVVDVSQDTSNTPDGAYSSIKLEVETANKKFGIGQILSAEKSAVNSLAELALKARASGISNLRLAILEWSGTADAATIDFVSAWNNAGTDPTLATNWAYANEPANLGLADQWEDYLTQTLDVVDANNIGIFIFVDDTDAAVDDVLRISLCSFESQTSFDSHKKGRILQIAETTDGELATTTTTIPLDDTIPQNTEGGEFMTVSITPKDPGNTLRIEAAGYFNISAIADIIMALFQGSTANALTAAHQSTESDRRTQVIINYKMKAGTTSSTTFKIRAGASVAGTLSFNGRTPDRELGGVLNSFIRVTEIES
ncbi:MAG: hypothetical protein MJA83_15890 [Gammaproteobacteria bacterium]|nr:hypothetical protein [Gammaproteobacteria bacterium]